MGQPVTTQTPGGICFAFPDVCLTPIGPVPIPYPNIGDLGQTSAAATTVTVGGKPAVLQSSEIPITSGDEPGVAGGVASGVIKGKVTFMSASTSITIEGKPIIRMGDSTMQNKMNAPGTVLFGDPMVFGG